MEIAAASFKNNSVKLLDIVIVQILITHIMYGTTINFVIVKHIMIKLTII